MLLKALLLTTAVVDGFCPNVQVVRSETVSLGATTTEVAELRATITALETRLAEVERSVAAMQDARVDALEAELAAVRRSRTSSVSAAGAMRRQAMAATAALSTFRAPEKRKFEPARNDEFVDDVLEDLIEIGGDPTFLEQARDAPTKKDEKEKFVWDGVIDETAHFDEDF